MRANPKLRPRLGLCLLFLLELGQCNVQQYDQLLDTVERTLQRLPSTRDFPSPRPTNRPTPNPTPPPSVWMSPSPAPTEHFTSLPSIKGADEPTSFPTIALSQQETHETQQETQQETATDEPEFSFSNINKPNVWIPKDMITTGEDQAQPFNFTTTGAPALAPVVAGSNANNAQETPDENVFAKEEESPVLDESECRPLNDENLGSKPLNTTHTIPAPDANEMPASSVADEGLDSETIGEGFEIMTPEASEHNETSTVDDSVSDDLEQHEESDAAGSQGQNSDQASDEDQSRTIPLPVLKIMMVSPSESFKIDELSLQRELSALMLRVFTDSLNDVTVVDVPLHIEYIPPYKVFVGGPLVYEGERELTFRHILGVLTAYLKKGGATFIYETIVDTGVPVESVTVKFEELDTTFRGGTDKRIVVVQQQNNKTGKILSVAGALLVLCASSAILV